MPQQPLAPGQAQQPQLTPQQQIIQDLQTQEPDKYSSVKFNGQLSNYGDIEFRRRQQQAEIDKLRADAQPNSPFGKNLVEQARQQTLQQHAQLNTGQPQTADDFNSQWNQNYQRLRAPIEATSSATLRSNAERINDYENKLTQFSEDKRPLIDPAQIEQLQGFKQGINTVDVMSNRYQSILQAHPELASNPLGGPLAKLESYTNDPNVRAYQQTLPLIQSYYAKHIGSDSGRLSNQELEMVHGAVPQPGDSPATVSAKAADLKQMLASDYNSKLAGLQQGMYKTGDFQPLDLSNPSSYAPTPRSDTGYSPTNPSNTYSPGRNPPPDPSQNPTVGQPQSQATPSPSPSPTPDYVSRWESMTDDWLRGNAKQQVGQQQAAVGQQQQGAAQQAQAAAQQSQAAAQQVSRQAQAAGAQAAQQQPTPFPAGVLDLLGRGD
jgi:hypothetical protein